MKKERKPKSFLQRPSYPGGPRAMREFLAKHLAYPAAARDERISGTVRVRMSIDYRGRVTDTKVLIGLGHGCDEEARRVVELLRFEVPKNRKIRATFHKTVNIHFKYQEKLASAELETPPPAPAEPQRSISYTVTKAEPEPSSEKKKEKGGGSYGYTISF